MVSNWEGHVHRADAKSYLAGHVAMYSRCCFKLEKIETNERNHHRERVAKICHIKFYPEVTSTG